MRKTIRITVVGLATVMGLSMVGCVGKPVDPNQPSIDPNKTQIYIDVYNGGTGVKWIEDLATEWNATQTEFEVLINGKEKFNIESAIAQMQSGLTDTSATVYYTVTPSYGDSVINNDYLVDLSDVLTRDVDGNGKTIGDKLGTSPEFVEGWKSIATKSDGSGMYALPYADSYNGFVYDHDTFLKYGWVKYATTNEATAAAQDGIQTTVDGNKLKITATQSDYYYVGEHLLTKGKDGKYGTYDDGQPETYAEWQDLIAKIEVDRKKAFMWTGMYAEYMDPTFYSVLAQIGGTDAAFDAVLRRNSNGNSIQLNDGSSVVINYDNGYLADKAQALTDTLNFMETIVCNEDMVNPKSYSGQTTHTDAQNYFLLGFYNDKTNPETAMLAEGVWWENEARSFFLSLENDKEYDRAYGKRRYRYMLYPDFENQVSDKSHFTVVDGGAVAIAKLPNTEKNNKKTEASKDFLAFTLKDENLRRFTRETGVLRAYKYDLTTEDRAQMTPFARCAYDIYHDTDNIEIMHQAFVMKGAPIYRATGVYGVDWINSEQTLAYANCVNALRACGAKSMIDRFNTRFTATEWAKLVEQTRKLGFID